jgi:hypothetical protein
VISDRGAATFHVASNSYHVGAGAGAGKFFFDQVWLEDFDATKLRR